MKKDRTTNHQREQNIIAALIATDGIDKEEMEVKPEEIQKRQEVLLAYEHDIEACEAYLRIKPEIVVMAKNNYVKGAFYQLRAEKRTFTAITNKTANLIFDVNREKNTINME